MYSASNEFHTAVANGAHQIALLIFADAVFTNDDIDIKSGIEFNDYFNTDDDLSIGRALSNEISFTIFNDSELLNNYAFGEFTATIGAQIGDDTVSTSGVVYAQSENNTYIAYASSPYLRRNGTAVGTQPSAAVKSILIYDGYVYCYSANNSVSVYRDSNGTKDTSKVLNSFMKAQMAKWEGKGIFYSKPSRILKIWKGTNLRTYEFVPLGVFTAERPNVPYVNTIDFTCYDRMQRFEKDMPGDSDLGLTYPCTFGNLFVKMCTYLNVPYRTSTFINSTATISARPDDFDSVTMREVLQWLAEAAGSVARFDRDGQLIMDWLHSTDQSLTETDYTEFNPYWYETKKITKMYNRASDGSYEITRGQTGGTEGYLIQDNPLLRGVT